MKRHYILNANDKFSLCGRFSKDFADTFLSGKYIWAGATTTDKNKVTCSVCKKMKKFNEV